MWLYLSKTLLFEMKEASINIIIDNFTLAGEARGRQLHSKLKKTTSNDTLIC